MTISEAEGGVFVCENDDGDVGGEDGSGFCGGVDDFRGDAAFG